MLEKDYVGTLGLSTHQADREEFEKRAKNPNDFMVAGPGFEQDKESALKNLQQLSIQQFKTLKRRKSA
jgi:thiamine monophosphate synthase